ncbi:MAG: hypothetical protein ACRCYO_02240, partial [Bacteroidia bacterium]
MKNIASLLLVITSMTSLHAQYYQRQYHISGNEILTCGTGTLTTASPYIMVGYDYPTLFGPSNSMCAVRVNASGLPTGSNTYSSKYLFSTSSQTNMRPRPKSVIYIGGTSEVPQPITAITGSYVGQSGFFLTTLSASGAVLTSKHYTSGFSNATFEIDAGCRGLSIPGSKFVYLAGHVNIQTLTNKNDVATFIVCIDALTNTVSWSKIYDLNTSTENELEIPSAIINANNTTQEIIVAGNIETQSGDKKNFLFRVNKNTGAVIGTVHKMSFPNPVTIRSIMNENTTGANQGYILCGDVENTPGVRDAWAGKLRPTTSNMLWSFSYDNNLGGDNTATKVIRGGGPSTYCLSGTAALGAVGNDLDMVVYEIDDNGGMIQLNTYGTVSSELGASISANTTHNGYCLMGTRYPAQGNIDFYAVSAYFNGVSGCNESFSNVIAAAISTTLSPINTTELNFTPVSQTLTVV